MTLLMILSVVFAISIASLIGGVLLLYKRSWANILSKYLINFAIGALFAVAFLDLLPKAVEHQTTQNVFAYALLGMLVFYLGEKTLLWYHHHSHEHLTGRRPTPNHNVHPVGYLITIGDAFHNFLDGVIIAAGFLVDFKLGMITSLAVLFHELPQEIGDFSVMLHAGMDRSKVFVYSMLTQLTAVAGALVGFLYLPVFENFEAIILAFAAGGFIYIASADLLPETHRERTLGKSLLQIALLLLGIFVVWYMGVFFPE